MLSKIREKYLIIKTIKIFYKSRVIIPSAEMSKSREGVVTQDGEVDDFGHVKLGGIGETVAKMIEDRTGFEQPAPDQT